MKQLLDEAVDEEKWPGQARAGQASQLWSCSSVSQRPDPMHQPQVPAPQAFRESKVRHPQSREEGHPSTEKHTPESRNNTIPTEGLGSKAD